MGCCGSRMRKQEPPSAAALLRKRRQQVIDRWIAAIKANLGTLPEGPSSALVNDVPVMLDCLCDVLEGKAFAATSFVKHANARHLWSTFSAEHLRREYTFLRKAIFATLESEAMLAQRDRDLIIDFLEEGLAVAARRFDDLRHFSDQLEKQYLSLIERLVTESAHMETLSASADRLLEVVREGMHAPTAALLLYQADTMELRLASSASSSPQLASVYRAAVALASAASKDSPEPRLLSVDELGSENSAALKDIGIEWTILASLPRTSWLPGTLCLGFHEKPVLEPIALQLLKVLGERLTVFLSRIDVYEHSKVALERARRDASIAEIERTRLESEGRRREEIAATITHDLRSPLNAAKMGTEMLSHGVMKREAAQSVASRVLRAIDRSDRMISTLLDTYRVRSGKPLQLTIDNYSMSDLARDVINDLKLVHGDRFVLRAEKKVQGYWSIDGMRRVLENLLTNAVKYGKPGTPITVDVAQVDGKMELRVHNEGPALTTEERDRILDPFERGTLATGTVGWGIGLTFVRGMVDAHGGSIHIESTDDGGTTFIVRNPMDSRPFQGGRGP